MDAGAVLGTGFPRDCVAPAQTEVNEIHQVLVGYPQKIRLWGDRKPRHSLKGTHNVPAGRTKTRAFLCSVPAPTQPANLETVCQREGHRERLSSTKLCYEELTSLHAMLLWAHGKPDHTKN